MNAEQKERVSLSTHLSRVNTREGKTNDHNSFTCPVIGRKCHDEKSNWRIVSSVKLDIRIAITIAFTMKNQTDYNVSLYLSRDWSLHYIYPWFLDLELIVSHFGAWLTTTTRLMIMTWDLRGKERRGRESQGGRLTVAVEITIMHSRVIHYPSNLPRNASHTLFSFQESDRHAHLLLMKNPRQGVIQGEVKEVKAGQLKSGRNKTLWGE